MQFQTILVRDTDQFWHIATDTYPRDADCVCRRNVKVSLFTTNLAAPVEIDVRPLRCPVCFHREE